MAKVADVLELYKIYKYLKMKHLQQSTHRDRMNTTVIESSESLTFLFS